jgi:hypothetical protein
MSPLVYKKPERISLKEHPEFDEKWVQERIEQDPGLLGLGTAEWIRWVTIATGVNTVCVLFRPTWKDIVRFLPNS